jgi:hypothetical protein
MWEWRGKKLEFWGRFEIVPIYAHESHDFLKWSVLSYIKYDQSPLFHWSENTELHS